MVHFHFFLLLMVLTLNIGLFNACSGAASKRAEILASLHSDLEVAPPLPTQEEAEEFLNDNTKTETPSEPDDPEEFNYFPYDLQMDTIAYMSCENPSFFTFKAGAYFSRSGLRLSEYFLQQRSSMSASALETLIKSSTKYQALPWFSYAHKNTFANQSSNQHGIVQIPLRLHRLVGDLIASGTTRIKPGDEPIEAQLSYGLHAASQVLGLNDLGWKLVLSYKGGTENKTLHKTGGDWGVDLYGRIYSLQLDKILTAPHLARYTLRSVSEEKRPEAPPQKDWVCPESLRFEIRRHPEIAFNAQRFYDRLPSNYKSKYPTLEQALNTEIPTERIPPSEEICPVVSSTGTAVTVARTVLGSNWNINTRKKCISLKDPDNYCYIIPHYQPPRLANSGSDSNCVRTGENYCPHFLSICVRKN